MEIHNADSYYAAHWDLRLPLGYQNDEHHQLLYMI